MLSKQRRRLIRQCKHLSDNHPSQAKLALRDKAVFTTMLFCVFRGNGQTTPKGAHLPLLLARISLMFPMFYTFSEFAQETMSFYLCQDLCAWSLHKFLCSQCRKIRLAQFCIKYNKCTVFKIVLYTQCSYMFVCLLI